MSTIKLVNMPEGPQETPKGKRFKVSLNPDQLKKMLRSGEKKDSSLYSEVARHPRDYQDALGLNVDDIEAMEKQQGHLGMYPSPEDFQSAAMLQMNIEGRKFAIFAKHTATHDYGGDGWQQLLMAIAEERGLNKSAGHGTTWITAVEEEWHGKIIQAINESAKQDDLADELFNSPKKGQ